MASFTYGAEKSTAADRRYHSPRTTPSTHPSLPHHSLRASLPPLSVPASLPPLSMPRSEVFSMIESGIYTARIVGPFIVGELAKRCGFVVAVGVGMATCVVDFVFILLAMEHFLPSKVGGICGVFG